MTTFKIGDAELGATPFDVLGEAARMRYGTSTLPRHVQALVKHFDGRAVRKLMSYRCPDGPWARHGVNKDLEHVVKQDFRLVGVDFQGNPTEQATKDLLTAFIDGSGLNDMNRFGQKLDDLFGLHVRKVPKAFFQSWVPRYSFDIFVLIRTHVVELWHPLMPKGNIALLSIPFEIEYFGRRTFDCQTGQKMFDYDHKRKLPEDLKVPDKAANESLRPRLKQELKISEGLVDVFESLRNLNQERAEKFPEDPGWAERAKAAQDDIDHTKKDIERRKARLGLD